MNLDQPIIVENQSLSARELIKQVLLRGQSADMQTLLFKHKILQKLAQDGEVELSNDEIEFIKINCLAALKDGATIDILKIIAPEDLE